MFFSTTYLQKTKESTTNSNVYISGTDSMAATHCSIVALTGVSQGANMVNKIRLSRIRAVMRERWYRLICASMLTGYTSASLSPPYSSSGNGVGAANAFFPFVDQLLAD